MLGSANRHHHNLMATPLVDETTGIPIVAEDGVPVVCETGDCGCPPLPDCVCENTEGVTIGSWDNTAEHPCNIVNCILDTYIWLVEFSIEWADPDPENQGTCTIVDGAFILTPDNTNTNPPCRSGGPLLYEVGPLASIDGTALNECCGYTDGDYFRVTPFNQFGHICKIECPSLVVCVTCHDSDEDGLPTIIWSVILRDETRLDVCINETWWRAISIPVELTSLAPGQAFTLIDDGGVPSIPQQLVSGKITLLGTICGGDYDGDGEPDPEEIDRCPAICAPALDFEITEIGNCEYAITNLTVPGACPIKLYVWSDGYSSELPERPNLVTNTGCGESNPDYRLTLWGIDDADCVHEHSEEIPACCKCEDAEGNPCSTPAGDLTATLQNPDEYPCQYLLEASAPDGEFACSTTAVIELRLSNSSCDAELDCDCVEIAAGDCGGAGCSSVLGDGDTFLLTIYESTTIFWRARETNCCVGEWDELELPCTQCECCDGGLTGVMMTIGGFTQGDVEGCADCGTKINGTYFLPFVNSCRAELNLEDAYSCECEEPCSYTLNLQVIIVCSPGTGPGGIDQILLFGLISSPPTSQIDFYREVNVPGGLPADCLTVLNGGLTNLAAPGPCLGVQCDGCNSTMTLTFS